jgi:hypothetical protein
VDCWSVHVPVMGHKSAWAEEETAPMHADDNQGEGVRRIIVGQKSEQAGQSSQAPQGNYSTTDILIVASKLKDYVKAKHGFNTSANVMEILSHLVRRQVDDAIDRARAEGRKTLMDRDFQ